MAGKKLVRDKIPELFNLTNNYIADDEEYYLELVNKLKEETSEFAHDHELEELADVVEVIHAIVKAKGSSMEEIEKIREEKAEKRGRFDKKIIWKGNQRIGESQDIIRLNANAIVTNSDGKFLLIRLKKGPFKGGLCIPGGGVVPGELSNEAAKREVLEETGVSVSGFNVCGFCELKHNSSGKQKVVMLLHAKGEGEPKDTEEGEARWMTYDEAKHELIIFADEAIKMWQEGRTHFRIVNERVV